MVEKASSLLKISKRGIKEESILTLVKMERQTLFRTVSTGIRTTAMRFCSTR